ncbi:hypothetical protein M7I_3222 [Glarea lozoyensis 74030]|uniref:Uncharacterized protein n=1 Tax=Glarea lozoyensis (strain ATCC 74030 / MF5533) TaxID=1104152 RepID=H0EKY8_GLAL7|nr:hypothetical protein M7I_3222 [Glarea lozoyensis 74030]
MPTRQTISEARPSKETANVKRVSGTWEATTLQVIQQDLPPIA